LNYYALSILIPAGLNHFISFILQFGSISMKKFLTGLLVAFTCFTLMTSIAEARRLGGGNSFGKQRAIPSKQYQKAPEAPKPAAPTPAGGNKWLGPLAGLALGAGLMSLFSGGFGQGFGNILMALLAAGVVMFLIAKLRKPALAAPQGAPQAYSNDAANSRPLQMPPSGGVAASLNSNVPQDFPVESFVRNMKAMFIRLQAANDTKNLDDVREFTTPEVYAEVAMQMQERGEATQKTEVLNIAAELLEVHNDHVFSLASVRFYGQLSENAGDPEAIDEVWFIQKHLHNDEAKWLLAGIKQLDR
jgi:predicted lipid-binding transport protein (Tim44 family)